jgi:anti-anti-sigma regulatory factor
MQKNVRLKLICRNEKVLDMIEILKIGKLFQIFPTLEDALKN